MLRSRRTLAKIAACGAAFAAVGGVAYAATDTAFIDSHGNINACLPPRGGQVHFWLPGHVCTGGWQPLTVPATAQVGARGATGPAGPAGATGPAGAAGPVNPAATTVDGQTLTKIMVKQPTPTSGTASTALYSGDGLTIVGDCDSNGDASLEANGPAGADSDLTMSGVENGATPFGDQTNALGPNLVLLGPPNAGQTTFSYASGGGQVVSGTIGYQKAPSLGAFGGCAFFGAVTAG